MPDQTGDPSPSPDENGGAEPLRPRHHPIDERFSFANERTFLAWNRTSLALITAGLAVTQLLPPFDVPGGRRIIGLPLIAAGTLVAGASYFQWQRNERAMTNGEELPDSILPLIIAVVVGVCAAVAFVLAAFAGTP